MMTENGDTGSDMTEASWYLWKKLSIFNQAKDQLDRLRPTKFFEK